MSQKFWVVLLAGLAFAGCRTAGDDASSTKSLFDANGKKIDEAQANSDKPAWRPLEPSDGLSGIGVLGVTFVVVEPDVCTAFLIDTGVPTGPAYVVTNAHCNFFQHLGSDMLGATEFRVNQHTDYFINVNHYVSVPEEDRKKIEFKKLAYITESDIDVAIFETTKTIAQVTAMGYKPLKLSHARPAVGTRVGLVGVPLRTRDYDKQSLHISSCTVGEEVALKNGIYTAPHSVKHKCSSIPGFSGGPLVADDGTVVLLNSHGSDDFSNDAPCSYESMPCEVRADGSVFVDKDMNYAQYVDGFSDCFNEAGVFDLARQACRLQR